MASDKTVAAAAATVAPTVVGFVYQVGEEIRASVVTRTLDTNESGDEVTVVGHSNMAVSTKGGTDTKSLAEALAKIPAAKHLKNGHEVKELGTYSATATPGISNLFVVLKIAKTAAK